MPLPYTTGDWTVSAQRTDTIATPKNIGIPDLKWSVDYAKVIDGTTEAKVANVTGADLLSHESVRFARSDVANIYSGVSVDSALQLSQKKGVQVMAEIDCSYKAANSVTGNEYDLPCKGRIVLRVPAFTCVTENLVTDLLIRTIASAFGTGAVNADRIMELIRGSLLPE